MSLIGWKKNTSMTNRSALISEGVWHIGAQVSKNLVMTGNMSSPTRPANPTRLQCSCSCIFFINRIWIIFVTYYSLDDCSQDEWRTNAVLMKKKSKQSQYDQSETLCVRLCCHSAQDDWAQCRYSMGSVLSRSEDHGSSRSIEITGFPLLKLSKNEFLLSLLLACLASHLSCLRLTRRTKALVVPLKQRSVLIWM